MEIITHRELCLIGANYMKKNGILKWQKPKYVVCELELANMESPDVFGFGGGAVTQLIEVKVSRADFLADKKKSFRKYPEEGIGELRSYLCPVEIIKTDDLDWGWGLIYYRNEELVVIKDPIRQRSSSIHEMNLAASIMRREGIKSQIFNYKKYKDENI